VSTERRFQARNAKAYEVELLVAPSRAATMGRRDQPKPFPLHEQEWLFPCTNRNGFYGAGSPKLIVFPTTCEEKGLPWCSRRCSLSLTVAGPSLALLMILVITHVHNQYRQT